MFEQLLEPFTMWDVWLIIKWYFACLVVTIALAVVHKKIGIISEDTDPLDKLPAGGMLLIAGFIMPIFEEVVFRGLPMYLSGSLSAMLLGTFIWTILHKKRAVIIAPFGILWLKMWMGGFGVEATAIHIIHNSFLVGLYFATQELELVSDMDTDDISSLTGDDGPNVESTINIRVGD